MSQMFKSIDGALTTTTPVVVSESVARNAKQISTYIVWPADVTAGKAVIESAPYEEYDGAWHEHYSADLTSGSVEDSTEHYTFPGPVGAVRGRIETEVSGGATPGVKIFIICAGDI